MTWQLATTTEHSHGENLSDAVESLSTSSIEGKPLQHLAGVTVPRLIKELLLSRGYTGVEAQQAFLSPKLKTLQDPRALSDMDVAVARLQKAFETQERVAIYADFDLDGTSGLALLKTGLKDLGFQNVVPFQPRRLREGYGLHPEAIETLFKDNVRLMVTVDVGITGIAAAEKAAELGMELIITDHHLPGPELPKALAIINPNKGSCKSNLGYLSGAGVAFYLLMALHRQLRDIGALKSSLDLKSYLDFFTIGTLTDLVPVIADNRSLVRHGLVALEKTQRPGLRFLLQQLELQGRKLYSQDITFRLAPKLNALSRLDGEVLPIDIFLAETADDALTKVEVALKSNIVRRQLQADAEEIAFDRGRQQQHRGFIWVFDDSFHKGVLGLVATKLAQGLNVPAFVGSIKEGVITGSCRLPDGSPLHLVEALSSAKDALNRFGGHRQAAGFELNLQNTSLFETLLEDHFQNVQGSDQDPPLICDLKCRPSDFTLDFCQWYEHLEPFGTDFKAPIFWVTDVKAREVRKLSGGHLKLQGFHGADQLHEAIWFSPTLSEGTVSEIAQGASFEMAGTIEWNHFRGQKRLQMLLKSLRRP